MFLLRSDLIEHLTKKHFFAKVIQFLSERTQHPIMLKRLLDTKYIDQLWLPYWDKNKKTDEYSLAIFLTFILAIDCQQEDAAELLKVASRSNDSEYTMKRYFSQHNYLRLSEFDL